MFLNKQKGAKPETPRSDLNQIATTHGGTGQKVLAVMVALGATLVIAAGIGFRYVYPAFADKKATSNLTVKKEVEVKPAADIKVPLDLDSAASPAAGQPAPAVAAAADSAYQPLPGLAGDARPSPAPARGAGGRPIGAPPAGAPNNLPPGLAGEGGAVSQGQYGAAGGNNNQAETHVADRKLSGDLGDFGDSSTARGQAASRPIERNEACVGIAGGAEAEAECNRRMPPRTAAAAPVMAAAAPAPMPVPQNGSGLSTQLVGIQTPDGGVGTIPHPHLTLAKGEPITCTLSTAIRTEQAGFVECTTDYPIYSMDGKVILAERGTRINGEYSRDASPGSNTIFVLWTRGVTPAPNFVTFDLFSPGSDRLGRSGIDGDVDNKYWERYSGPLMFSVIQDASAIAVAKASGTPSGAGGSVFVLPSTQSTGQNAVAELLKQGSDVKRSIYRNQGDTISITVARYVDFTPVYKLRSAKVRN